MKAKKTKKAPKKTHTKYAPPAKTNPMKGKK